MSARLSAPSSAAAAVLNRRDVLRSGGAVVIGLNLAGCVAATPEPMPAAPVLARAPAAGPPDPEQIDTWIAIHGDDTATVFIGFVELGQGASTALPQVAAEELDLGMDQIRTVAHDTHVTPFQFGTYSSAAIARGAPQVRAAAAEARLALLTMASEQLGAPVERLTVERGVVRIDGQSRPQVSYGELIGDRLFELAFTGTASVKDPSAYTVAGVGVARRDLPLKAAGTYEHIQHRRVPGMLHGRVVRPRGQRAYGAGAPVVSIDEASIAHIPDARVLRKGDFIGVVAPKEWDAVRAARDLAVVWDDAPSLPPSGRVYEHMRANVAAEAIVLERGDADRAIARAAHVASNTVETPYQSHATFAPNCALADVTADSALIVCSSQDIYAARRTIAPMLGLEESQVRVQYQESSGTYGKSCYDDVAQAAALMSQMAGAPVRVQFMRWDEHGWDTLGPAHIGAVRVGADTDGRIVGYTYDGWQHSWSGVETSQQLADGAAPGTWPFGASRSVNPAVCGGMYAIADLKLIDHQIPGEDYPRAAWLRSPLDLSMAFTSEQAIDELAFRLGVDPYAFRKQNIADERWEGVLDAVAEASGWTPRPPSFESAQDDILTGRGIGLGTHLVGWGAAVAEIEVDRRTGQVTIRTLYGAIDAGLAVNPANVEAQIMGQLVQTTGRMLYEETTFDARGVTSLDWSSYRIARFEDVPQIVPIVVQRVTEPCSGAGEEAMAAAAAAIGNAFFDATGVRMRTFPMTPVRVLERLQVVRGG